METILAIETSTPDASVALWRGGEVVFADDFKSDRNHNSMVFEPLTKALDMLQEDALTTVLVGTGPGSYSGIRIGIAVAQGVAIAQGCSIAGLGSLAATPVTTSVTRGDKEGQPCLAIGDARRGLYYISQIAASGEALDAELMDAEAFTSCLMNSPESVLFSLEKPIDLGLAPEFEERVLHTRPEARLLIDVWLGLDEKRRSELAEKPPAPAYLRAPFTSKAKAGHPLLRNE